MLPRHLFDSLSITPYLTENRFIDVGSGAGLPGIPLAIALPEKHFTLLDSQHKKTRFLNQVCYTLGLSNIRIVHARVETFIPDIGFDAVITRAFAPLAKIVCLCQHLLKPHGKYYAMKGKWPTEELTALTEKFKITGPLLQVPGLNAQRHLIILEEI
jgi:16S rRNA (guanine527-N7)-methyltransferase